MLTIGPYTHPSNVIVAPMAGVTDQPFRNLCRHYGAHWLISEMVTSDVRLWHTTKSKTRLSFSDEEEPRWVQLAGADPVMMAEAAEKNVALGAQIIDINMGCPAKKVCNKAAGSALLRDPELVTRILKAVVEAARDVPVTLKTRLGWSKDEQNVGEIARIAEGCGIQLLTIHGRTRACRFKGDVDYRGIAEVKASVSVPVIANGDIDSAQKAKQVLEMTGADGIMIGRAAQGAPWLPAHIDQFLRTGVEPKTPGFEEVRNLLIDHVAQLCSFYGERQGVRIARKHVGWSLDQLRGMEQVKRSFYQAETHHDQQALIAGMVDVLKVA